MRNSIHGLITMGLCLGLSLVLAGTAQADSHEESAPEATEETAEPAEGTVITGEGAVADDCTWFPDFRCGRRNGRYEGFHKPIVAPYLFEDPFVTTGLAGYYIYHEFPNRSIFGGGDAHVAALQARVALTDKLALIATKDGYAWVNPGLDVLDRRSGWMNIAAGLKYAFLENREKEWILSGVLRYEVALGSQDVFQGHSSGVVIPSLAGAWGWKGFHLVGDLGGEIPIDTSEQSTSIFYHLMADYNVTSWFAPFIQLSGQHWTDGGDGSIPVDFGGGFTLPLDPVQNLLGVGPFEGADVINLGVRDTDGLDLITFAIGAHFPLTEHMTLSLAYERPISSHKGIHKQRVTTALVWAF